MKNDYGKLTKKKAIELLYKYDSTLEFFIHKILYVEILRSENESDCAVILVKSCGVIDKYFISCFGISVTLLIDGETNVITNKNVFLESEGKTNE